MSARNMAKRTAAGTLALAVCLGGGAIALASAASADANFKFDQRIQGDDRYGTAIAASKAAFDKADNVILVNGYATVDGLTASYLAGVANAPILYVSDKGADDATKAEIKRLGAKNIWLVGGEKVIPASVADAIKGDGYTVNRINGSDRYETAALIAEAGIKISGKKPSTVFVASGTSFADALAVSPVAFVKGYPIILTDKDSTSDFSKKELGVIGTDSKVLVGGTAVVSDKVAADLSIKSDARVAGDDRAVTANKISDWAKKTQGFNPANAALVGGTNGNGADSLVAAPLLGKSFTTLHFAGWDATAVYMKDHSADLTGKGFVFGGKAAVSDGQVSAAQSAAQTTAAVVTYVVTDAVDSGKMWYADPATKTKVSVALSSSNVFLVDGTKANIGVFQSALSAGDLVSWSKDSSGVITYSLTNKAAADYTTGFVGVISGTNAKITEPITNTVLSTIAFATDTYRVFSVDGSSVSQSVFANSINVGDTITVTGKGTGPTDIQTVAIKSATVSGAITGWTAGAANVSIKTDAGAVVSFAVPSNSDTMTVDGKATTTATDLTGVFSNGDKLSFGRSGGVSTFALVNATPPQVAGQIVAATDRDSVLSNFTYVDSTSHSSVYVNNSLVQGSSAVTTPGVASTSAEVQTLTLTGDPSAAGVAATKLYLTVAGVNTPVSVTVSSTAGTTASNMKTAINTALGSSVIATLTSTDNINFVLTWTAQGPQSAVLVSNVESDKAQPIILTVDGSLAASSDVANALTLGDTITYQAADSATKVKQSFALTSGSFAGTVNPATTDATNATAANRTVGIYAANSTSQGLGAGVSYRTNSVLGLSGTPAYTVNGVSKTLDQFESALNSVDVGGATGVIKLTQGSGKLNWDLTVSVN